MLVDDAIYRLPDSTLVRVRVPYIGSMRLETMDGQPAYIHDGAWKRLAYKAARDAYEAAPCDLTDADLTAV